MSDDLSNEMGLHPALETLVVARTGDLGGFEVRRSLPSIRRRMVGPFIFLDQMGPATMAPGRGIDVRPHPHIGLATVTYLFEGELLHRDNLGTERRIQPGAVNWMTAGRGIAHSERTPAELRAQGPRLSGLQAWVALPKRHEETAPSFVHHGAGELPVLEGEGARVKLIAGGMLGKRSPAETLSDLFYADAVLEAGTRFALPSEHVERAVYLAEGEVEFDGETFRPGQLLVFRPGSEIVLKAPGRARMMLLGGEPMDGPRYIWWNFVSSSQERMEEAKAEWREGRFTPVIHETEFIPLPER